MVDDQGRSSVNERPKDGYGATSASRDLIDDVESSNLPSSSRDVEDTTYLDQAAQALGSKKALWAYVILCFSTGPTSSMVANYIPAAIQSAANYLGHQPGSDKPCGRRGNIRCVVRFGTGEVDYLSYVLYLRAIARATEGIMTILTSGIADYSSYRKTMMVVSITLFGALALPSAGLTGQDYSALTTLSVLYVLLNTVSGVYTVVEASYIPLFMRSRGWFQTRPQSVVTGDNASDDSELLKRKTEKEVWSKGFQVSVLGLVSSNIGGILALLIGVIITYSRGTAQRIGYIDYLLAVTIAGCLTIVFGLSSQFLLPSIRGRPRPNNQNILLLPTKGWIRLISSLRRYPQAFKWCLAWILWNTGYTNFLGLIQALFLEVSGIDRGSGVFTVWTFTSVILACIGGLTFMFTYPHIRSVPIKAPAYVFLSIQFLCALWGCIGISNGVSIGYKHSAEFWVQQVLFMSTGSALRSYNRTIYASLLPKGSEAQFFGLELTLDLAVGWINPLVQGVIQARTHNLRFPMLPNALLMFVSGLLYLWVDVDRGISDARVPLLLNTRSRIAVGDGS